MIQKSSDDKMFREMRDDMAALENALEQARADADRLAKGIDLMIQHMPSDSDVMHCLLWPNGCDLTVGDMIAGLLALHRENLAQREE